MLLWVAVFFCLVVPLHHRGLISLPGAVSDDEASKPYCPLCTLWDGSDGSAPPADAPISCAPTPYDVVLPIHRPPSVSQRLVSLSPA